MLKIGIKATQETIEKEAVKEITQIAVGKTPAQITAADVKNIVLKLAEMHGIKIGG